MFSLSFRIGKCVTIHYKAPNQRNRKNLIYYSTQFITNIYIDGHSQTWFTGCGFYFKNYFVKIN